jgi:hypothetical protein
MDDLLGHPVVGRSWESFVVETLSGAAPQGVDASFYRTAAGAEVDLLLTLPGGAVWAIEIERSCAPKLSRRFHQACADLLPQKRFVDYPGDERFPPDGNTDAIGIRALSGMLSSM